jgi:uncharacterized metal-binding protein
MFFIFLVIFMVIDMSDIKIPACAKCKVTKCRYPESKGGVPDFCAMKNYPKMIKETVRKNWTDPELERINIAWENLLKNDRLSAKTTGQRWTRVEEIIEYAKLLNYKKIGLAFCVAFFEEVKILQDILEKNRFKIVSVCCMAGREGSLICNPLSQAEVLNQEETELNIMFGLCVGHDVLFIRHSEADVTPLVIKDRFLDHNPILALRVPLHYNRLLVQEK